MKYKELSPEVRKKVYRRYQKVNLYENWDRPTSDKWSKRLSNLGIIVARFTYQGFYKRGNGASYEAEVNIAKFISKQNVKKMVIAGIDIMWIRKMRNIAKENDLIYRSYDVAQEVPHFSIYRNRNAVTRNPLSMDVNWRVDHTRSGLDEYTCNNVAKFLKAKARYYATLYYKALKKEYDQRITEEAVVKELEARGYDFDGKGEVTNMPQPMKESFTARKGVI